MITVNGTLQTIAGEAPEIGQLIVQLCGYGSQIPRIPGSGLFARTKALPVAVDGTAGTFSVQLAANNLIVPSGTYYTFDLKDSNGSTVQINAYQILGADRTLDLSTLPPFDPSAVPVVPIPTPNIVNRMVAVPWAANLALSGAAGLSFEIAPLQADTTVAFAGGVPGNLYTLVLQQAADTPHAVTFDPATIHGGSPAPLTLAGRLIQTFVCRANGTLDSIGIGAYL